MKRLITVFWTLIFAYPLFASAPLDSIGSYKNFVIKKELWICTSIAFPVDISYDAFNVDFKTIVQGGYGYFVQVHPGKHPDGSVSIDASAIIKDHASAVLNVVGKPAGVYEYVFVSTDDNFCGMGRNQQSVVRIYLVPQPTGFPVLTNVCPGVTETIDFNNFIPPEIKYFIDEMGWTINYTRDGQPVTMPVEAGLGGTSNVGNNVYRYTFNDATGEFAGRYAALQKSVYFCPEDSAYLTHTVRVREGEEYAIPNKSIAFCTDVLRLVPETWPKLNTNLFGYLGSSAPNGIWLLRSPQFSSNDYTLDASSGSVVVPVWLLEFMGVDSVVFEYKYKNCSGEDPSTLLTFNFSKTNFQNAFTNAERDICRNLMSGVVELSSIFGFTVPLTSGIWYEKTSGGDFEEMLYGAVDISEMKSGSLYTFRYDVTSAVDSLCLVQGSSTEFNLRMHDLEVANAEARICKTQFESGVTVDLSRYVPGLNDTSRINPNKIVWYDNNGARIANPSAYQLKSTDAGQISDTANYKMQYRYSVESDCGPYSGSLYISAVDSIAKDTSRTIVVCYTDDYAKHIDLFQVLGVVGAGGEFTVCESPAGKTGLRDVIEDTGIMDASKWFDDRNESEKYTFCYLRGSADTCVPNGMEVTVIVTRDVKKDSKFE